MDNCNIILVVEPDLVRGFYELLQGGFTIKCQVGTNIEDLFNRQLVLNPQWVEEKISTIFLNGRPVDDITTATVHDGSTLALSGAMPGLVGATLRRKSPLATFRQSISTAKDPEDCARTQGYIQIKLFNILLEGLGPVFLTMGIFVKANVFKPFLAKQTSEFWMKCKQISVDGASIQETRIAAWPALLPDQGLVFLKVLVQQ